MLLVSIHTHSVAFANLHIKYGLPGPEEGKDFHVQ